MTGYYAGHCSSPWVPSKCAVSETESDSLIRWNGGRVPAHLRSFEMPSLDHETPKEVVSMSRLRFSHLSLRSVLPSEA
jgi:hypothetical protein